MTFHDPLLQRQIELEIEMSGLGHDRYLSKVRKYVNKERGTETDQGRYILESCVEPVAKGIREFVEQAMSGRAGPKHTAVRLVKDMDPEVVAYLASRAILGRMMKPRAPVLMTLAVQVSRSVELEARFTEFRNQNAKKFDFELKRLSDGGATEQHKAAVLTYAMNKCDIPWDRWSRSDMIHLGIKLVELFCEHTGLAFIQPAHEGGDKNAPRDQYLVHLSTRAQAWIEQSVRGGAVAAVEYLPMVSPPKPWDGLSGGGYWSSLDRALPLVRKARKGQLKRLAQADLTAVFEGLNAIQNTGWQVNGAILDVMKVLAKSAAGIAGLVPRDKPLPDRPPDIDTNPVALREWKWAARDVYTENLQLRQDRLKQEQLLNLADRFRDEQAIYFPHNLDFRGRAYPIPEVLHPQGSDPVKALLRFAEGKRLGRDGARWLAIHGANTFGIDKVSFDERVAWVEENHDRIGRCAVDPLGDLWWTEADKPWCFLAFCLEWTDYQFQHDDFVSHLPIALDGSCNGLQHFSAMLLDSVGGAAVNLVPALKPQDIYQRVADRVMEQLRQISSANGVDPQRERWAYEWLHFGIDRKITKRPVMVLPYGGTPRSCLKYVDEAIRERIKGGQALNLGDELKKAIGFLSSLVWDSIGDVVIAARDAMGWLQGTARVMGKENLPMHWTTPSGFVAWQEYVDQRSRLLQTKIAGKMVRLREYSDTDQINPAKQATSISPNYVHSMDASAMILTVAALWRHGLRSFAMIHDSYAVHACDTSLLATTLRQVFVDMYRRRPLHDLRRQFCEQLGGNILEPLPKEGSLNLEQVLQSDFFFA